MNVFVSFAQGKLRMSAIFLWTVRFYVTYGRTVLRKLCPDLPRFENLPTEIKMKTVICDRISANISGTAWN